MPRLDKTLIGVTLVLVALLVADIFMAEWVRFIGLQSLARGVVARSVAALSKGPNRLLGYVENMSGYYCRDCDAIKPLFVSPEQSGLEIPCLATVPFDPELARRCDRGIPLAELSNPPVGLAREHVAQQLLDSLESTTEPLR